MDFAEIFAKIGFDGRMALFNSINFLVFFLILYKFVFSKIGKGLKERQELIEASIKNAEKIEKELLEADKKTGEIINNAQKEANEILNKYKQEGEKSAEKIRTEAQSQIETMQNKSLEMIEKSRVETMDKIKEDTADLAVLATEKILGEKINEKEDRELIVKYLKDLNVSKWAQTPLKFTKKLKH